MRRSLALSAALLTVLALGSACGSDDDGGGGGGDKTVKTITINVADGVMTPSGDEVDVDPGQPVNLVVTADAPGEIHVHSSPEKEFEYKGTGKPETFPLTIDRPGEVDIESHTLDQLIVKLVVQ
jgi:plastocyanin